MRMEIARMFGQWPHELLAVPASEYRRLQRYYFAVREAEKPKSDDNPDLEGIKVPDGITVTE